MLPDIQNYDALLRAFQWKIPSRYNMGVDVSDRWAAHAPDRPAIFETFADGRVKTITFGDLSSSSNRLANGLRHIGVERDDRVAILLPQMGEVAVSHIAIYKLGAIALPLATLFGADALAYRLGNASVKVVITNASGLAKLKAIRDLIPNVEMIISTDGADGQVLGYDALIAGSSPDFTAVDTSPDDPALIIYTSGTTGQPKGALHGHRVLLGHLPGVQFPHEFFPQPGDLGWTPADWAWAGGLLNMLLPALHFGVPVVARAWTKFDPEAAFRLMADHAVRNVFIPPTALRMLRAVDQPRERFKLNLRTIGSAGEALGAETFLWGQEQLGLTINEYYGQTECNLVLGSSAAHGVSRAGAIGKAIPGHDVAMIRNDGSLCAVDEPGQIAVKRPDPVMFLGYWDNEAATTDKFLGDWMTTGDQGTRDSDGYIHFLGRDDDVITSSGFRIGPGEIEDCLLRHKAVYLAGVVGKPDKLRTEIVKAFVVLRDGFAESPELAADIQAFVRTKLSAHEYPREIAFVKELPLTTTGKIIRRILRDQA